MRTALRRLGAHRIVYALGVVLVAVGAGLAWLPLGPGVIGAGAIWAAYDLIEIPESGEN